MLRLAEAADTSLVSALCSQWPVFGDEALLLWHTFGEQWKTCCLWLGGPDEGPPNYALCRYQQHFTVVGHPQESREQFWELVNFLQMQPVDMLQGSAPAVAALGSALGHCMHLLPVMTAASQTGCICPDIVPCSSFTPFFCAMAESAAVPRGEAAREAWLARIFPMVCQQNCVLFARTEAGDAVQQEGKIVCGGSLTFAPGSHCAVLADLFTVPACRGQRWGKDMVLHLCAKAAEKGRQVYLVCGQASLVRFYRQLGFKEVEQRGVLYF